MATSGNGWVASPDGASIGIVPFRPLGVTAFGNGGFPQGIKGGAVAEVFTWLVEQLHKIEPMMTDPNTGQLGYGCWAYSYRANVNNPNSLSNHSSGTAIDYNAPRHANGTSVAAGNSGWSPEAVDRVRQVVNQTGVIRWLSGNDPMHFEIAPGASEADVQSAANRLRRDNIPGGTPTPTPAPAPTPTPSPVTDVQEDDDMATHYYVVHNDKTVYRSTDNFTTWVPSTNMAQVHQLVGMANLEGSGIVTKMIKGGKWVPFTHDNALGTSDKQGDMAGFGRVVK